jgi:hypothetical protein
VIHGTILAFAQWPINFALPPPQAYAAQADWYSVPVWVTLDNLILKQCDGSRRRGQYERSFDRAIVWIDVWRSVHLVLASAAVGFSFSTNYAASFETERPIRLAAGEGRPYFNS